MTPYLPAGPVVFHLPPASGAGRSASSDRPCWLAARAGRLGGPCDALCVQQGRIHIRPGKKDVTSHPFTHGRYDFVSHAARRYVLVARTRHLTPRRSPLLSGLCAVRRPVKRPMPAEGLTSLEPAGWPAGWHEEKWSAFAQQIMPRWLNRNLRNACILITQKRSGPSMRGTKQQGVAADRRAGRLARPELEVGR